MRPFDNTGEFHSVAEGDRLRALAVRGAGVTVFSQGLKLGIQIVSTVVLARLLTPKDFGVYAMVTTASLLLVNFGLNGFTEAVIQQLKIDHALASSLFWINLGAAVVLATGFASAGSMLARLYHEPLVTHVAEAVSLTILIQSTAVIHLALLKRGMHFSWLAANDLTAQGTFLAVAILLGSYRFGYWALVSGAIASYFSTAAGAWWLCRWIPGPPRKTADTGGMVRFALNVYGRFTLNYVARNTDNLLVAWRFDAAALGFYKKAYDLFTLPSGQFLAPLTSVAVATLSRVRDDATEFRRYLVGAAGVAAFFGVGIGTVVALAGPDMIRIALGPGWDEAGRIIVYFGPGIGIMFIYGISDWIHLSIGRPDRWLRWGIVEAGSTILLFCLGLRWGPEGVALAWTTALWTLLIPALWYAGKPIGFEVSNLIAVVWRYLLAGGVGAFACFGLLRGLRTAVPSSGLEAALVRAVTISTAFAVLYLTGVIAFHGGLTPLRRVGKLLLEMVQARKVSLAQIAG